MIHLAHIFIYPIKSLPGVAVKQAIVLPSGALQGDREFAMVDENGKFVNGKRTAAVHSIRSRFDLEARTVSLWLEGQSEKSFHLDDDRGATASWLGQHFGFPVKLVQNTAVGFPDDTASPGPTIITIETLQALTTWFPSLTVENLRQRLRTNLELTGAEAFWEERLYRTAEDFVPFQIGAVQLMGINPCQRCIVPTRDPITGGAYANFQKIFTAKRRETLPQWAETSRFNHFYRLAINTRLAAGEANKVLQVSDRVKLVEL